MDTGTAVSSKTYYLVSAIGSGLLLALSWPSIGGLTPLIFLAWVPLLLLWLGIGASGLGYFLWNKGATLVSSGVLAIMNNALIPAGLLVNLVLWGKDTDLFRLSLGALLMLASLWVCQRQPARSTE